MRQPDNPHGDLCAGFAVLLSIFFLRASFASRLAFAFASIKTMQSWMAWGEINMAWPGWEYRSSPDRQCRRIAKMVVHISTAASGMPIKAGFSCEGGCFLAGSLRGNGHVNSGRHVCLQ